MYSQHSALILTNSQPASLCGLGSLLQHCEGTLSHVVLIDCLKEHGVFVLSPMKFMQIRLWQIYAGEQSSTQQTAPSSSSMPSTNYFSFKTNPLRLAPINPFVIGAYSDLIRLVGHDACKLQNIIAVFLNGHTLQLSRLALESVWTSISELAVILLFPWFTLQMHILSAK